MNKAPGLTHHKYLNKAPGLTLLPLVVFDYYSAAGALPVLADPSTPYEYEQ